MYTKPNNRIYHFCKYETAVNYILPNMDLLLNPIVQTNDPRENKSFIFSIAGDYTNEPSIEKYSAIVSDYIRNDCKVLCFSEDFGNRFGYELSNMWAHYGGIHKGICLELDKEEFIVENNIDRNMFKNIKYVEFDFKRQFDYKILDLNTAVSIGWEKYSKEIFRTKELEHLFFTKSIEWSFENEIRLVRFSNNSSKEYCSIKKSIRNVYVGLDFDMSQVSTLKALVPDIDISTLEFIESRMRARII